MCFCVSSPHGRHRTTHVKWQYSPYPFPLFSLRCWPEEKFRRLLSVVYLLSPSFPSFPFSILLKQEAHVCKHTITPTIWQPIPSFPFSILLKQEAHVYKHTITPAIWQPTSDGTSPPPFILNPTTYIYILSYPQYDSSLV